MTNYKFVTDAFEGSVVEEGTQILDVPFEQLDDDLQIRIREYGEELYPDLDPQVDFPISLDDLKEKYETSWQSEETEQDPDLVPVSEQ